MCLTAGSYPFELGFPTSLWKIPLCEGCWDKVNASLAFWGHNLLDLVQRANIIRVDALDGPEKLFLAGQGVRLSGCKMRVAGVSMRKVLQPAQMEKDHEQQRGGTPCRKTQRTTTFCSVVCNTTGVCREDKLWGFGNCYHTGCFVWLLFAWGNLDYFSPARHRGKQWPASSKTDMILGRMGSWKKALVAWAGHARSSVKVCLAIVLEHLQLCPWARAWGGSCCHSHLDQTCQGEWTRWKSQDTLKGLLQYHYWTVSFKSLILTHSYLFFLCFFSFSFFCLWCKAETTLEVFHFYVVSLWPCQLANRW